MPDDRRLPLWAGRTAAFLGIVLVAFSLRQAVAAISPILSDVRVDIPLSNLDVGWLGTLPPLLFAASGFIAPHVARRLGLDGGTGLALLLITAGHLIRAAAPGVGMLLIGSVVAFAGTGIGNVLLPSIVRRYFPDRVALLTAVYACVVGVSTAVPAALAAPVAQYAGWRFSLGIWSITPIAALVPWLVVAVRERRRPASDAGTIAPSTAVVSGLWRSRVALSITLAFSTSTILTYASFAWLPEILSDVAGTTPTEGGVLLAVTGLVSVPGALLAPLLVGRLRNVGWVIAAGIVSFALGYLGLLLAPAPLTLLWILLIGAGSILFPVCLVLINGRTRTPAGTVALSGFAQGIAYAVGALGPLLVGLLHDVTGGWTLPLLFLLVVALVTTIPAVTLARPAFVEDELAR
ncbi:MULTISPECIES: CynX/NimT family MFS transporter [unclassified Curtobacterium]|uniref:MFS transporter n=1 Tax=unclassified Curtobacterium TaxID=257496 RepID=UPI0008DC8B6D|nr:MULTISPECIES: MFS transporter [unclassified Curtobacterium]OIH94173.1 ABC transporter permease [Curtobacterium sp. MCBA15_003]OII29331.1 ABC transporter permease [Curtobacterium sp. MMLR14_006]